MGTLRAPRHHRPATRRPPRRAAGRRAPRPSARAALVLLVTATLWSGCTQDPAPEAAPTEEPTPTTLSPPDSTIPESTLPPATLDPSTTTSVTSTLPVDAPPPIPFTALPAGFTLVAPAPDSAVRGERAFEFGTWTGVGLTDDGGAVVAVTHVVDPATGTTALLAVPWDATEGEFSSPRELARVRLSPTIAGTSPIAMASSDGSAVAVAHEVQDDEGRTSGIVLRASTDGGETWDSSRAVAEPASAPSAAVANGVAFVSYVRSGAVFVAFRRLDGDDTWTEVAVPLGEDLAAGSAPAVAIDDAGRAAVAFVATTDAGTRELRYWDGRSRTASTVLALAPATAGASAAVPLGLVFAGTQPTIAVGTADAVGADDGSAIANGSVLTITSTDEGATFGPPEVVPGDGPRTSLISLSLSNTSVPGATPTPWALTYVPDTTSRGDCGLPKVVFGTGPSTWEPCTGVGPSRRVTESGLWPATVHDSEGRVNLVLSVAAADGLLAPGVYLWRAPEGA